ncbi:syntaxin-binding protein 4 isoform X1 [Rattus norvegicus]|uniref:Syntaxin binding protein 4 n=1 Tax=Rattus norvegicus TaxID=10116 RepID=A0ABK0LS06_RAT|nr:syntaxin-binding protein 4 [Rattus norvegicus]|eukprot:XP_006247190.1 PREDICTED: syntaxin-binding protein 4 isoform X1 [Rattus norvegicus]
MDIGTSSARSSSPLERDPAFRVITVAKETGLGLKILGGIDRNEGPLVYIHEVTPGGDCYKDGRLKPGDQLVSINKESMIGVSFEEAKNILTRAKLRWESPLEIAFIRQKSYCGHPGNICCQSPPVSEDCEPQTSAFNLLSSPAGTLLPKTSSTPRTQDSILPSCTVIQTQPEHSQAGLAPVPSLNNRPTDTSNADIAPAWTDDASGPQGKISLNPSARLKAEKLEMALNYLGIQPTKEQHEALRQQVQADSEGTVSFGDFVQVARNLFCLQLDEVNVGDHELPSVLDSQLLPCGSLEADEVGRLRQERNAALEERDALKEKLLESEKHRKQLIEELQNVKQEAKAVAEETRALRSRIHLAEAAQRQARGMEMDYEEVIRLLEAEVSELKARLADYSDQNKESVQDLRKRVTVLDCQLRKSEMARKTFKSSTERLLRFVEAIQEVLLDSCAPLSNLSERRAVLASQTSLPLLGRNGRNFPAPLLLESKELLRSVRAVLDMDCLPYGWEEAYTADGIKYFINHVTQTTSWIHPMMSVLNLSCAEESEEDCPRELREPKS